MCLNCGCGEYEKRHKPSDITMDDLKEAAKGQNMDIRKTAGNLQEAGRAIGQQGHEQEGHKPQGHEQAGQKPQGHEQEGHKPQGHEQEGQKPV